MLKYQLIKAYYYIHRFIQKVIGHDFSIPFRQNSRVFISNPPGSALKFAIETDGHKDLAMILQSLKNGDTFFDVGANFGLYTLSAYDKFSEGLDIHCFEPELDAFRRLLGNKYCNNADWKCHNFGLGDKEGWLNITSNLGGFNHITTDETSGQKIRVMMLDQYVEAANIENINVMKVDVEGFEFFVLKGAEKMLKEQRIKKIFFEVDDHESRYNITNDDYSNLLESCGYKKRELSNVNFQFWEC